MQSSCAQDRSIAASQMNAARAGTARKVRPRASAHLAISIDSPAPYRCRTATKMSDVAAAMSVAISHSSRCSSTRFSTRSNLFPPISPSFKSETAGSPITPPTVRVIISVRPAVHLDVEFLGEEIEHVLSHPALRPFIRGLHRFLPRLAIGIGKIMQRSLARLLDLG